MNITTLPTYAPKHGDYRIIEMPDRFIIQRYHEITYFRPRSFLGVIPLPSKKHVYPKWKHVFDETKPLPGTGPVVYDVLWYPTLTQAQDFVNKVKYDADTFPRYWYCN